jgi:hypothetical protein
VFIANAAAPQIQAQKQAQKMTTAQLFKQKQLAFPIGTRQQENLNARL